jgi:hypothetical protein
MGCLLIIVGLLLMMDSTSFLLGLLIFVLGLLSDD